MAKGDGSITQRGKGVWEVAVSFGKDPVTGKYRRISKTVHGTKRDAAKVRNQIRREQESGISAKAMKTITGDFLAEWIENRRASGELAHATITNYERYVRTWISPYLGAVPLHELKPYTIESWHRKAREDGASPRSIQAAHKVLKQALKAAVRYELLNSNPCDRVSTPKAEERKRGYLDPSELHRMLEILDSMQEDAFTVAVRLGIATGVRRGEALGLDWAHVDFARGQIIIEQALTQVDGAKAAGLKAKQLGGTKTENGKRRIAVDAQTIGRLKAWKRMQAVQLMQIKVRQAETTPVCCSLYKAKGSDGVPTYAGGSLDPQGFTSKFAAFCDKHGFRSTAGRRLCFHELRHTQATLLLSEGEDVISVAGRLGHASPSITTDMYAHAMPEKDRECADVIGRIMRADGKPKFKAVKTA